MSDEMFGGYTLAEWNDGEPYEDLRHGMALAVTVIEALVAERDFAIRSRDSFLADLDKALARAEQAEAELGEALKVVFSSRTDEILSYIGPCVVSADGKVTPLPDGLVVLVDGRPHRLEPCPDCLGGGVGYDNEERCTNPDDLLSPDTADYPLGVVAVPVDTEEET